MITKETAGILFAYGYKLGDKEGNEYKIDCVWDDLLFLSREHGELHEEPYFKQIGIDFFILCRPLSDLMKEIEHNGEMFVPIVEVGKMIGYNDLEKYEEDGVISYGWTEQYEDDAQGYEFNYDEELKTFGIYYDFKDEKGSPICALGGLNEILKLYSWHFNIDFPEGTTIYTR